MNKQHEFCASSSFDVNLSTIKIVIFGYNKRKLNLGIGFYLHGHFRSSSRRQRVASVDVLMGTSRKEAIVGVICWEIKSCIFEAFGAPNFPHMALKFGEVTLENSPWKVSEKGMKNIRCITSKALFNNLSYYIGRIWRTSHGIISSIANYELSTTACPLILLLVGQSNIITLPTPCRTRGYHLDNSFLLFWKNYTKYDI